MQSYFVETIKKPKIAFEALMRDARKVRYGFIPDWPPSSRSFPTWNWSVKPKMESRL